MPPISYVLGRAKYSIFYGWSDTWQGPGFREWNMKARLGKIHCPVLAIQGGGDEYGTEAQVRTISDCVAGRAESLMVPECGHIPHHQARELVLREMTRFIMTLI